MVEDQGWHRERHRHHEEEIAPQRLLHTYRFELTWLAVVALGVFLVLERMNIRQSLVHAIKGIGTAVMQGAIGLDRAFLRLVQRMTFSDALGAALILGAAVAMLLRLRWWLMHTESLVTIACPVCGAHMHRIHRKVLDRIINWYLPVRRYRCVDASCGWNGLRVDPSSGRSDPARKKMAA